MGKLKRKYNANARKTSGETIIDRSAEKKIRLDGSVFNQSGYDDSNALVLPSRKRKTKREKVAPPEAKKLSKKKRRYLECVIQRREKKAKRGELLEALQTVQVDAEEIRMLTSTSEMQSRVTKSKLQNDIKDVPVTSINTIKGGKKKSCESASLNEGDDSDSSVNTSDITTDAEDNANDIDDDDDDQVPNDVVHNVPEDGNDDTNCDMVADKSSGDNEECDVKSDELTVNMTTSSHTEPIEPSKMAERVPSTYVSVERTDEVQEARLALPILGEEQAIMETVTDNPVTIICGETGSGKTTQVPQFLYEAGYALNGKLIAVTEPRRVAAISMSQRVAYELSLTSRQVSYQIRYEGNVTEDTRIKFLTDGVLLKEIQKDFTLTKYSAVVIDEAHERSVYTDILIGLLSRIVPLRNKRGKPLKLIIMSATLRVEDFTENTRLFKVKPPVIQVQSRQFPVTVHFNKRTPLDDYIDEAFRKICKIHRTLPEGGILVFVTGQQEVHTLARKLRKRFPPPGQKPAKDVPQTKNLTDRKKKKKAGAKLLLKSSLPKLDLDNYTVDPYAEDEEMMGRDSDDASDISSDDDDDDALADREVIDSEDEDASHDDPVYVLPLFSLLPSHKQTQVFQPVPMGARKIVVSTNVAETSLTIPDIKYVVDTGKVKEKLYDKVTGVSKFEVTWVSKASANQRAGRAGRVAPGHCYRLYSSAVYNDFTLFSKPEICRRPVDDLVLQMKDMKIHKVDHFPFPTPPDKEQIKAAERLLVMLGALDDSLDTLNNTHDVPKITQVGHLMACFPVAPRYSCMLSLGHQHDLLPYVVALVAALSVQELFIEIEPPADSDLQKEEQKTRRRQRLKTRYMWAGRGEGRLLGDLMVLLKAVGSAEYDGCSEKFCDEHGIRYKAMREIRKLRVQLTNTVNAVLPTLNLCIDPKLPPPSEHQTKLLRQIVLAAYSDHVARRCSDPDASQDKHMRHAYYTNELEDPIFIHPLSVLYKQNVDFIIYQQVVETSRLYMKGVSSIEPQWLPLLALSHCSLSKPLEKPPPRYEALKDKVVCHFDCTYGRRAWTIPRTELDYPRGTDLYRWFARFLLEGHVIPSLAEYVPELLSAPATMIKSWAKLQPRTDVLLKALISRGVTTKSSLISAWTANDKYLLSAYCEWLPMYLHDKLKSRWPPIT